MAFEPLPQKGLTAPNPRRRRLLWSLPAGTAAGFALWAWRGNPLQAAPAIEPLPGAVKVGRFDVTVSAGAIGTPVNRRVLGSNVQWVDGGDNLLAADNRFDPAMLMQVKRLAPTVLRYPGGAQTDGYHWQRGLGDMASRGLNDHVNAHTLQPTRFGTREFLELCEATGAAPLISANLVTGTPDEAAQWLTATNVTRLVSSITGQQLPRVVYWELGNEPYLKMDSRPELDLTPAEFARRAGAFIRALRAVDPSVRIGLPLTQDRRNGVPVTPYPGFTTQVLAQLTEPFDYVCVHNAYAPFATDAVGDATRQYWGAMAGARSVQADLAATRAQLDALRPGVPLPLAVTEYSPLFTLGAGANDDWITTPAGALYLADVLRLFAASPNVLLANQWSLSGNWKFGALHQNGYPRPAYEAMRLFGEALRGELLPAPQVQVEQVATRSVGLVPAVDALPLVEAMVTRETSRAGRTLRVLLIHKDPKRRGAGRVALDASDAAAVISAQLTLLSCTDPLDARDVAGVVTRSEQALPVTGRSIDLVLPPCSIALLTLSLPLLNPPARR